MNAPRGPQKLVQFVESGQTSVRMVLGVASLPLGMPVELEVILKVAE